MRRIGGPQLKNIIRTETQDGKSLLDAHFAHATAAVKRWLRRKQQNKHKEAASPEDLTLALSYHEGLQNCGVQKVNLDSDVKESLVDLAKTLADVSSLLNDYFSRCNEINFYTEKDSGTSGIMVCLM
jgi:hypothetical protein